MENRMLEYRNIHKKGPLGDDITGGPLGENKLV